MEAYRFRKTVPTSVGIFGARSRIGSSLAKYLAHFHPEVRLRLFGSNPKSVEMLQAEFPRIEVVHANYMEPAGLEKALDGIEGLFVVTQDVDERVAMSNLVAAIRACGCLVHMIRILGMYPDFNVRHIPPALKAYGMGLETQHPIAKQVLDESDLPVTIFNCGASYMDNYLRMVPALRQSGVMAWTDRLVTYVDPRDVAEAVARVLLSEDARHIHNMYTLNNGEPPLRGSQVAEMMTRIFRREIRFDGSREGLLASLKPLVDAGMMNPQIPEYLWNFFEFEEERALLWVPNQFLERTLGRKPVTMQAWLQEHRRDFFPYTD